MDLHNSFIFAHIYNWHKNFHYSTVYIIAYNQFIWKVSSVGEWSKNVVQAYSRLLRVDKKNKLFSHVEYDIMNIKFKKMPKYNYL